MTDAPADWRPVDDAEHAAQIDALRALLAGSPRRILDLGAGDGRIAAPLTQLGHDVLAIDNDPRALEACAKQGVSARLADMTSDSADLSHPAGPADFALCLGHTFMLLHDPEVALAFLRRLRAALAPEALIVIDNFPEALWPDVHSGAWTEGVSEDGALQILWARAENVFALREGGAVDESDWSIRDSDRLHRLWSMGELRLLAESANLAGPETDPSRHLVLFRTRPTP